MSLKRDNQSRTPRKKWFATLYRLMAAGRYLHIWLPELIILYERILAEEGEEKAREWVIKELLLSIQPSLAFRVYQIGRVFYLIWKSTTQ